MPQWVRHKTTKNILRCCVASFLSPAGFRRSLRRCVNVRTSLLFFFSLFAGQLVERSNPVRRLHGLPESISAFLALYSRSLRQPLGRFHPQDFVTRLFCFNYYLYCAAVPVPGKKNNERMAPEPLVRRREIVLLL